MKGILKGSFEQNRFKLPIIRKGFPVYNSGCLTTHYKAVNNKQWAFDKSIDIWTNFCPSSTWVEKSGWGRKLIINMLWFLPTSSLSRSPAVEFSAKLDAEGEICGNLSGTNLCSSPHTYIRIINWGCFANFMASSFHYYLVVCYITVGALCNRALGWIRQIYERGYIAVCR